MGVVEAVDIRAHQANAVFLSDRLNFFLALHVTGFGITGRNQNRADHFLLATFDQRAGNKTGRYGKHRNIYLTWNILDRLVNLLAQDLIGLRVNWVDHALVAAVDEIFHHRVADLAVLGGGADYRNRLRLHDPIHLADDVVMVRTRTRRLRCEIDDDAHVRGDRAGFGREYRVEIHLGDLRKLGDQSRDVDDDIGDRVAINGIAAPDALQHFMGLDAIEHRERVLLAGRRQTKRNVL